MRLAPLLVAVALSLGFAAVGATDEPPARSAALPKASLPFLIDLPSGFEVRSWKLGLDSVVYDVMKTGSSMSASQSVPTRPSPSSMTKTSGW
jgi:hypothetical protein